MPHSTFAPVLAGLRLGLHVLLVGLAGFAVVRAFLVSSPVEFWTLIVGVAFVAVYLYGAYSARTRSGATTNRSGFALFWVCVLTFLWAALTWLSPEGAYLVFPLFFLYLHVLPGLVGVAAVAMTTAFAILALCLRLGFSIGGIVGPIIGASIALLIGLAYRTMVREAQRRERLLAELVRTRQQLAETEREQGMLGERARLAREIHDTVAQGLASIQMLLRAAERGTPEPGAGYLKLARETAADSLAETRQIIRELTPTRLGDGLAAALRRLAREQSDRSSLPITVVAEELDLSMDTQTALLRIAQGALSNSIRHANAARISIELKQDDDSVSLVIGDDGCGFDASMTEVGSHGADSFGLHAMYERVEQLDGTLTITSTPGAGATVIARLPLSTKGGDKA